MCQLASMSGVRGADRLRRAVHVVRARAAVYVKIDESGRDVAAFDQGNVGATLWGDFDILTMMPGRGRYMRLHKVYRAGMISPWKQMGMCVHYGEGVQMPPE